MEFLRIQIPTDRTSGTRTRATQMLTNTIVEICSTRLITAPRRLPTAPRRHAYFPPIHDSNLYLTKRWYRRAMQHNRGVQDYIDNHTEKPEGPSALQPTT